MNCSPHITQFISQWHLAYFLEDRSKMQLQKLRSRAPQDKIYKAIYSYEMLHGHTFFKNTPTSFHRITQESSNYTRSCDVWYLTVVVQEPKISDKIYNKWHVMEIIRVVFV